jgi:CRP/FNR family cyclic AMP-dependent transcriptional regulator
MIGPPLLDTEVTMNGLALLPWTPSQSLVRYWDCASAKDWAKVLAQFPLFSGMSKRRVRKLVRHATFAEFAPGDTVVARDAPANWLYVILGGTAKTHATPEDRTLRTGDYLGEVALIAGSPRSATVIATGDLHVMRLPRGAFLRVAKGDPGISLTLLRNLATQFRTLETQAARRVLRVGGPSATDRR